MLINNLIGRPFLITKHQENVIMFSGNGKWLLQRASTTSQTMRAVQYRSVSVSSTEIDLF